MSDGLCVRKKGRKKTLKIKSGDGRERRGGVCACGVSV